MTSRSSRALAGHTLRDRLLLGLLFGVVGLLVAIALYFASPWLGQFPDWGVMLWPTAVMMLALSAPTEPDAATWTAIIIGSNAILYFVLGFALTRWIIFVWRTVVQAFRPGSG